MTDYTALGAAAETLRSLLAAHITASDLPDLADTEVELKSPEELRKENVVTAVSLWLYRVALQPDMLNAPRRRPSDSELEHHPLPLELSFLVTAYHRDVKTQLALLGRVLQVVNDHSRLRGAMLKDAFAGTDTELRLSLDATSLIETSDLWYSLQSPFRLSVPLRMQVVSVGPHLPATAIAPILARHMQDGQLVGDAS